MKMVLAAILSLALAAPAATRAQDDPLAAMADQIAANLDARVGYVVRDTGSGQHWAHNADERFPMASTAKVLVCAALLRRVDDGADMLGQMVPVRQSDLVTYSPVTETMVGQDASLGDLCAATMRTSDNTAVNLVLDALGGPEAVTEFLRDLGDETSRLDRWETELNEGVPGDPRDTTSPAAMAATLERLVLGDGLAPSSRALLTEWLVGNEVGGPLLRAGIPNEWRIGDRTGAGGYGTRGVVAVIWPPEMAPLITVFYLTETEASMEERDAAIATFGAELGDVIATTR